MGHAPPDETMLAGPVEFPLDEGDQSPGGRREAAGIRRRCPHQNVHEISLVGGVEFAGRRRPIGGVGKSCYPAIVHHRAGEQPVERLVHYLDRPRLVALIAVLEKKRQHRRLGELRRRPEAAVDAVVGRQRGGENRLHVECEHRRWQIALVPLDAFDDLLPSLLETVAQTPQEHADVCRRHVDGAGETPPVRQQQCHRRPASGPEASGKIRAVPGIAPDRGKLLLHQLFECHTAAGERTVATRCSQVKQHWLIPFAGLLPELIGPAVPEDLPVFPGPGFRRPYYRFRRRGRLCQRRNR